MGFHEDVERSRAVRDEFFAEHYASPLPEEDRADFVGLDYFPPDERWRLTAQLDTSSEQRIAIPSSIGTSSTYTRLGRATVHIAGAAHHLEVFDDGDGNAFIPFRDATNGDQTYGGGRYVTVEVDADGRTWIDFNEAHNPYCAYDEEFVCPLPPAANALPMNVPAGERTFVRTRTAGA